MRCVCVCAVVIFLVGGILDSFPPTEEGSNTGTKVDSASVNLLHLPSSNLIYRIPLATRPHPPHPHSINSLPSLSQVVLVPAYASLPPFHSRSSILSRILTALLQVVCWCSFQLVLPLVSLLQVRWYSFQFVMDELVEELEEAYLSVSIVLDQLPHPIR